MCEQSSIFQTRDTGSRATILLRLGVSQSSIYRIVPTLLDKNYLRKVARNAYTIGHLVVSRGFSYRMLRPTYSGLT
ncbi:hypothetical protein P4S70_15535, partial [Enterovibrio sp. Hal110]